MLGQDYSFDDFSWEYLQWADTMGISGQDVNPGALYEGYMDAYFEPYQTDEWGGYYDEYGTYWEPGYDASGGYYDEYGTYWEPGYQEPEVDEFGGYYDEYGTYWAPENDTGAAEPVESPMNDEQWNQFWTQEAEKYDVDFAAERYTPEGQQEYWDEYWSEIDQWTLDNMLPAIPPEDRASVWDKLFGGSTSSGGAMSIPASSGGSPLSAKQIADMVTAAIKQSGGKNSPLYSANKAPATQQASMLSGMTPLLLIGGGILALAAFGGRK